MTRVELADLTWGDVVSDDDGILVMRAEFDGRPVVVKRFASVPHRREIAAYEVLRRLGAPTLPVLGAGPDWIVLADLADEGWRRGTPDDLYDPHVARLLARWYDRLHAAGATLGAAELDGLYSEADLVAPDTIAALAGRWPGLALQVAVAQDRLPAWRAAYRRLPRTLTYNDFWYTNLAVATDGTAALMFDLNLLGAGPRAADVRNVTVSLSEQAAAVFLAEYGTLAAARGLPFDPDELAADEPLAHLATLVVAATAEETPHWALDSLAWLRGLTG